MTLQHPGPTYEAFPGTMDTDVNVDLDLRRIEHLEQVDADMRSALPMLVDARGDRYDKGTGGIIKLRATPKSGLTGEITVLPYHLNRTEVQDGNSGIWKLIHDPKDGTTPLPAYIYSAISPGDSQGSKAPIPPPNNVYMSTELNLTDVAIRDLDPELESKYAKLLALGAREFEQYEAAAKAAKEARAAQKAQGWFGKLGRFFNWHNN